MPTFPRAYTNQIDVNESDPMMKRVPPDKMGIGARSSGLPKDPKAGEMMIQHVGTSAGRSGN
jgi:hypothetical protein